MTAISTLIEFLAGLMSNEDARTAFERNPNGTLANNGLDGVTGQDVRDARLIMADDGGVRARNDQGGSSPPGSRDDDPVREIHHTTNNYEIDKGHHYSVGDVDQTFNIVDIDDRDTVVVDSFNSADTNNVVAIQDNSQTDVDVVNVEDSFNTEPADGSSTPVEDEPVDEPFDEEPVDSVPTPVESEPAEDEDEPELDPVAEAAVS